MAFRIRTLQAADPPDSFPDPATAGTALGYPDGLLAIGGDLSPERLLAAYRHGIFPWFNDDQPILWWSPDPRAVIYPEHFHMSRSLLREIRRGPWEYSLNQSFDAVVAGCASNRGKHGTWITAEMRAAYRVMHELGYAHSVESWRDGELAGGIYGLRIGKVFFGESMFSSTTGGSKVAIAGLIAECRSVGIGLLDCQLASDHLLTLGMEEIPRQVFLDHLAKNAGETTCYKDWHFPRQAAAPLESLYRHSPEQS